MSLSAVSGKKISAPRKLIAAITIGQRSYFHCYGKRRGRTRGVCYSYAKLPTASTTYARMATQAPYVVTYGTGVRTLTTAITAITSEAMNQPLDGT